MMPMMSRLSAMVAMPSRKPAATGTSLLRTLAERPMPERQAVMRVRSS